MSTDSKTQVIKAIQPTKEMIDTLITEANWAPSGDNSQPWKFLWDDQILTVFHSEQRAAHSLNRHNHASLIALGSLLETVAISASQFGFIAHSQLRLETENNLSVWAEVRFTYKNIKTDPLYSMIRMRCTDRRPYRGGKLSPEMWQQIQLIKNEYVGCRVRKLEKIDKPFLSYYLKCEELLWKNSKGIKDLCRWMRLSKTEVADSKDGMSWENMGLNRIEALVFQLIRRFPSLPKILWSIGFGKRIKDEAELALDSSEALLCFTGNPKELKSFFQIGRMAYRIWLLLNSQGHAVQPLTFSSLSIADAATGALQDESFFFQSGLQVFKKSFSLRENEIPIWMFRTGQAPAQVAERTTRQEIENLLVKNS